MLSVHWATSYVGISNSFGYHVHDTRSKAAIQCAGVELDDNAPVAFHVCPPHQFIPIEGKRSIAYCAWECRELPMNFLGLHNADALILTASFLVEPFRAMFPHKPITVAGLGVGDEFYYVDRDTAHRRPNLRPPGHRKGRPLRFLWVGAPNARKGPLHVLEAWKGFQNDPRVELYLKTTVLDGATRKGLKRFGNIIFDDRRVELPELVKIYHDAHCFLFPSCGEGFGLTFAEALATGLPAIYPPETSLVDIAPPELGLGFPINYGWHTSHDKDFGIDCKIVSPDTNDLYAKMLEVIRDPPAAFRRGKAAAEHVRSNFTWPQCGAKLRQVVEHVAAMPHDQPAGGTATHDETKRREGTRPVGAW